MGEFIKTEKTGHVLTITMERPHVMNALHAPACHELSAVLDEFQADPGLWIGIITGAGDRAFVRATIWPRASTIPCRPPDGPEWPSEMT